MAGNAVGEFERIRRFYAPLAGPGGLGLLDDAALIECRGGRQLVVTADAIVEGVHYLPSDPPDLVARKLLRVNLSDLAAMAARHPGVDSFIYNPKADFLLEANCVVVVFPKITAPPRRKA